MRPLPHLAPLNRGAGALSESSFLLPSASSSSPIGNFSMAIPSDLIMAKCSHCLRDIPTSNIDLHYAHCSRNLQKCAICGDMISKKHADEHYNESHAPVDCSLCSERVERDVWSLHKGERCPKRMVTCEYCELPLPAVDLFKHQEICGNRTEYCNMCNKYVRLRERFDHDMRFHGNSGDSGEPSRNNGGSEREERPDRRPARDSSQRLLFYTISMAGVAVLVGSFFLQRKVD